MQNSDANLLVRTWHRARHTSLRWQICVLTGTAVLISLTVMGYLNFTKSRDVVVSAKLDALETETRAAANVLEQFVAVTQTDVLEVPEYPPIPGILRCLENNGEDPDPLQKGSTTEIWLKRLGTILVAQMEYRPERLRSTVVDATGNEIAYVDRTAPEIVSDSKRRFEPSSVVNEAMGKRPGEVVISRVEPDVRERDRRVHLATPFTDASGTVRGVFIISLNADFIFKHSTATILSGTTDIVDETGRYVFCEENSDFALTGREYRKDKPVRAALLTTKNSDNSYRRLIPGSERPDGVSLISIYNKCFYAKNDSDRFWAIAPSIDAVSELAVVDDIAWRFMWLALALILAVGLVTFVASKGLTGSLQQLEATADRIAQGDLDTDIPDVDPIGEVRGLRDSLAKMTDNLRQTISSAQQQQQQTAAILNSTADGIISIGEDGRIRSINSAALRLFGIKRDDAIGSDVGKWVPALFDTDANYTSAPIQDGEVRPVGEESEVTGHHQGGRNVPLALRVTEMGFSGERMYIATLQDITERQLAEDERQRTEAERIQSDAERERIFEGIRDAVKSLATSSTEILAATTQQATSAQEQAASVTETATTVEELTLTAEESSGRAREVAESADRAEQVGQSGRKSVDATVVAMKQVRQQVESIAENIMSLSDRAQAIGSIIEAVKDIADQTNLLALNAAIEASRAGEHGRGFAVVASEVKALADQSRKATEKVSHILGEIQQATNASVMATEQGTKSVSEAEVVIQEADQTIGTLSRTIGDASISARQILASANQQATAMRQIRDAMSHIDLATKQTLSATRQSEQSARDLNQLGDRLRNLIDRNDGSGHQERTPV